MQHLCRYIFLYIINLSQQKKKKGFVCLFLFVFFLLWTRAGQRYKEVEGWCGRSFGAQHGMKSIVKQRDHEAPAVDTHRETREGDRRGIKEISKREDSSCACGEEPESHSVKFQTPCDLAISSLFSSNKRFIVYCWMIWIACICW